MKKHELVLVQIYIFIGYKYVCGIDCYECTSVSGANSLCEDKFRKDLTTAMFISRKCDFGLFKGTNCIKLKGTREDGTSILVRQCGHYWGSHCGDIKYMIDEASGASENINGCLESCDFDGCNHGEANHKLSPLLTWFLILVYISMTR